MDFLYTTVGIVALLFILVGVHEYGHFAVARLSGVRVLRFCIGMGNPIVSFKDRQGTEFGLAPIPLGGYVKMLDEREGEVQESDRHYCYNRKPVWKRIAILSAGPLANFILAFGVFSMLAVWQGELGVAPIIGEVKPGSMADRAGLAEGQEIRSIDGVATPTHQAVLERLLMRLGETGVMEMTLTNPDSSLAFEVDVPLDRWMIDEGEPNPIEGLGVAFFTPKVVVAEVMPDGAADAAGLKAGDKILATDDVPNLTVRKWVDYVRAHPEQDVTLELERDNEVLIRVLTPQVKTDDEGASYGFAGVSVGSRWPEHLLRQRDYGLLDGITRGAQKTWETSVFVLVSMKKLVLGQISTKNLSGPIGIAKVAGDRAQAGLVYFVEFLALLSISLGVLNLLPIPILDGGQIVYCLVEGLKGSPISEKVQMMGYSAGLAILACVMVLALYNDILRL